LKEALDQGYIACRDYGIKSMLENNNGNVDNNTLEIIQHLSTPITIPLYERVKSRIVLGCVHG